MVTYTKNKKGLAFDKSLRFGSMHHAKKRGKGEYL